MPEGHPAVQPRCRVLPIVSPDHRITEARWTQGAAERDYGFLLSVEHVVELLVAAVFAEDTLALLVGAYRDRMDTIICALREQLGELAGLLADFDEADLGRPSSCPGWSVVDVVLHLAQTNDLASASAQGRWDDVIGGWDPKEGGSTVDQAADVAVATSRGLSAADVLAWWQLSSAAMLDALAACQTSTRVRWVAGEIAAQTLATTRLSETWVHTLDVAEGLGRPVQPTARLWHIARLVHRTIPYAFAREGLDKPGSVRFSLEAPESGDVWEFGSTDAPTSITGAAYDLCRVAGQRSDATHTALLGTGPDAAKVLRLMRTFA